MPEARWTACLAAALAAAYVLLYFVSDWLSDTQTFGHAASAFFLPAAVRLLGFLLVGFWVCVSLFWAVAFLLAVGAYSMGLPLPHELALAGILSVSGPAGAYLTCKASGVTYSGGLSIVSGRQLLLISAGCSLGNAIGYYFALAALSSQAPSAELFAIIFLGDAIGMWFVVYTLKLVLTAIGLRAR